MKDLKVLTVCGAGVGTSTLLRMNINDAFKAFNLPLRCEGGEYQLVQSKGRDM